MNRITCPIHAINYYNEDTRQILLKLPEGQLIDFKAGQYLEIVLPSGKKCPFSIASPPEIRDTIELHVKPTPDSSDSVEIESLLDKGEPLDLELPKGDCFLDAAPGNTLILLAASTGITQMKSIVEHLLPKGLDRPVWLYWGVPAAAHLYLDTLCRSWTEQDENFHYVPVVSEPDSSPEWKGRTGLVGEAALEDFADLADTTVFVSGGPAMVYATFDAFVERGMPAGNMFSDIFSYAPRPTT